MRVRGETTDRVSVGARETYARLYTRAITATLAISLLTRVVCTYAAASASGEHRRSFAAVVHAHVSIRGRVPLLLRVEYAGRTRDRER